MTQCKLIINIEKQVNIKKCKYVCIKLVRACWENWQYALTMQVPFGTRIVPIVKVKTFGKKERIYPSLVTKQQALIHTFQNLVACFDEHSRQAQPYFKIHNNNFLLKANILVRLLFFVKEKKNSNEKKKENKEWIFFNYQHWTVRYIFIEFKTTWRNFKVSTITRTS